MPDPAFDAEEVFNEDYLYFYSPHLDGERSDADTELITRLLQAPPEASVLDLGCGHGRIANRLAERGYRVTGLDLTPIFLEHAHRDAADRGVEVEYVQGDMRQLPWTGQFEAVVNWFTTFGYFDDANNRLVLRNAAQALKPGGVFLLELNNFLNLLLYRYQPSTVAERDGDVVVDRHAIDPLTSRNYVDRVMVRRGLVRRTRYSVRMFTFPEIRDWLLDAGFTDVRAFGEQGEPLTMDHRRMIVSARR